MKTSTIIRFIFVLIYNSVIFSLLVNAQIDASSWLESLAYYLVYGALMLVGTYAIFNNN